MSEATSSARVVPVDGMPGRERRTAARDDARQRGSRLAHAVKSWFAGGGDDDAAEPAEHPAEPSVFQRIGAFLQQNLLEPTPPHYELVYGYITESDRRLVEGAGV